MSEIQEQLQFRYATQDFDPSRKVSKNDLQDVLAALRFTPSPYNFQPWGFVMVTEPELREKLVEAAPYNKNKILNSSQLFIICARTDLGEEYVDQIIQETAQVRSLNVEDLAGLEKAMNGAVNSFDTEGRFIWAQKQSYIALGFLLMTCAQKRIDACPMEGFDKAKFDEILGLKKKNLRSTSMCAIGYRNPEDPAAFRIKARRPEEKIFIFR